jgi:hypothetical protein
LQHPSEKLAEHPSIDPPWRTESGDGQQHLRFDRRGGGRFECGDPLFRSRIADSPGAEKEIREKRRRFS